MNGKVISGPAAVLIIVLFFLPWVTVSCDGVPMGEFSGYHLAAGTVPAGSNDVFASGQIDGDPILFVIPLVGLVTLILLGVTIWKSSFEANAGWGQIIASFLGLLILGLEWLQLRSQGEGVFDIVIQPALWGTITTLVAIGGGAVFDLVRAGRQQRPLPYAPPPMQAQRPSPPHYTPPTPPSYQQPPPPAADSNYTIMDEEAYRGSSYASETILDDDLFAAGDAGSETIIDDEYKGVGSDYTVFSDDETGYDIPPRSTTTPEDLAPTQKSAEQPKKDIELVWKVSDEPTQTKPTPPPVKPDSEKTEVLNFSADTSAWLVIGSSERRGEQFRLQADTLIGRDTTNDVVIDDTAMSNTHARIRGENGRFFIYDQNSTNGIFIFNTGANRWEKRDEYELQNGDQIKLGRTVLHFMTA